MDLVAEACSHECYNKLCCCQADVRLVWVKVMHKVTCYNASDNSLPLSTQSQGLTLSLLMMTQEAFVAMWIKIRLHRMCSLISDEHCPHLYAPRIERLGA